MAHLKQFQTKLDNLFRAHTNPLRTQLGLKIRGKKTVVNRSKVQKTIKELQNIASQIIQGRIARIKFDQNIKKSHSRKLFGRGVKAQSRNLEQWISKTFEDHSNFVYVFWRGKECLYVGRTGNGGKRPSAHLSHKWCNATRIKIYAARTPSQTPMLECLAIHRFKPKKNVARASMVKWQKKCPICKLNKEIANELHWIFAFKQRKK